MRIILGLGNPGPEYANTRHNAGIMLVDRIYDLRFMNNEYGWRRKKDIMVAEFPDVVLVKTAGVFMNESGRIINDLRYMKYDLGEFYLAHDDLDIRLGEAKIHLGKGPKVHNGVNAVEEALGMKEFWRIRIGVENREQGTENKIPGETYVLGKFPEAERKIFDETLVRIVDELFH